jgi:S-methylmethionine-dependent homocysteine/selenocysteine methylase
LEDEAATDEPTLRSGESVAEAVHLAQEVGAAALLFNCSQPEVMEAAEQTIQDIIDGNITIEIRQ